MMNKEIHDLGEQIKNMVDSAIASKDFQSLNRTVTETINQTVDGVKETVRHYNRVTYTSTAKVPKPRANNPMVYIPKPSGSVSGPLMTIFGFGFGGVFGITTASLLLAGFVLGDIPLFISAAAFGLVFLAGMIVGGKGLSVWKRIRRYRKYIRTINGREFCKIEELCKAVCKQRDVVIKDLQIMIQNRMFLQGHLDEQKQHFMVTDQVYEQYLNTQAALKQRQQVEESLPNDECRAILREGNEYIRKIHEANDDIPGEEMSDKLYRLEATMKKIFRQVEKDPDIAKELHKFMNYYLPTTMKLIDAYREIDMHQLSGGNISSTKKEIEDTLDTINTAFENLLDRFFQEKAWDISSDISVMKSMLAQEGLVEQGLKMPQK